MEYSCQQNPAPIGVGGVGGSGTRLVANLMNTMGVVMAGVVNASRDNMVWPPFRKLLKEANPRSDEERRQIIFGDLTRFERQMHADFQRRRNSEKTWFWKVPTTFFWLEYVAEYFPRMKYVHVIRHGLDMAFTRNVRQFANWAQFFDLSFSTPLHHSDVLAYWIKANQYATSKAIRLLGSRYFLLRFDDICLRPEPTLRELADFLEVPAAALDWDALGQLIAVPPSIGRYKSKDYRGLFTQQMIDAVESFGFHVE
jgi:hypothetical protein